LFLYYSEKGYFQKYRFIICDTLCGFNTLLPLSLGPWQNNITVSYPALKGQMWLTFACIFWRAQQCWFELACICFCSANSAFCSRNTARVTCLSGSPASIKCRFFRWKFVNLYLKQDCFLTAYSALHTQVKRILDIFLMPHKVFLLCSVTFSKTFYPLDHSSLKCERFGVVL